jgi:hypothetical protein
VKKGRMMGSLRTLKKDARIKEREKWNVIRQLVELYGTHDDYFSASSLREAKEALEIALKFGCPGCRYDGQAVCFRSGMPDPTPDVCLGFEPKY